jgi:hypothetical protein
LRPATKCGEHIFPCGAGVKLEYRHSYHLSLWRRRTGRHASGSIVTSDCFILKVFHSIPEQKRAHDAFFATKQLAVLELPTGQGLVVKPPE